MFWKNQQAPPLPIRLFNTMKHLRIYKYLLLITDILFIPGTFFFWWLSGVLLAKPRPCLWNKFGGQCITCGGTHFVRALLQGDFIAAFHYNPFLFVCAIVLILSFILLHFTILGKSRKAQKLLSVLFSIPSLILGCVLMMLFLLARNGSVIVYIGSQIL